MVISYPVDLPCPVPSSGLSNHVCDLCLFSYPDICFSVPVCDVSRTSFHLCFAAASLFFAWVVNAHVSAPYVIAGSTHDGSTHLTMSRCLANAVHLAVILL